MGILNIQFLFPYTAEVEVELPPPHSTGITEPLTEPI